MLRVCLMSVNFEICHTMLQHYIDRLGLPCILIKLKFVGDFKLTVVFKMRIVIYKILKLIFNKKTDF